MNNEHIGSSLDDFLDECGDLENAEAIAIKRVIAYKIQKKMEEENLNKTFLAKKLNTSRSAIDRLLDPQNTSITLQSITKVAKFLNEPINRLLSVA